MMNNFSGARFAFAKLVVNDLVKMDAFYRSICEYPAGQWVKAGEGADAIEEVIYRKPEGGVELVLLTNVEGPPASCGSVNIAFDTGDLDLFEARVLAGGGAVLKPIRANEFNGAKMRIAFYTDPEGYVLEVIER